ncbi:hypothetical protein ACFOEP_12885 [Microbacterium amylolyticum]|uniref:hypothetical protein n=1 Tax=Microbacterium amylolyticum TaxID=936337 RepID=UPI003620F598
MIGVELDPTTASIARGLYPQAAIRTESFAETPFPDGHVDAVVGNVPFGNVTLHDPRHNAGRHSMHNHFIIKSLALTRPGGLVAVLTSHYTLDAQNPAARREMSQMADLVGAVRLPSGAHRRAAGTEVVTDLLVFRKREAGEVARDRQWETTTPRVIDGEKVSVNAYFDDHPAHILGDLAVRSGAYGSASLHVDSSDLSSVDVVLRTALDGVVDRAIERGQTMTQPTAAVETARTAFVETDTAVWDGTLLATDAGIMRVRGGRREPVKVAAKNVRELTALIKIRDAVTTVLDLEASSPDDTDDLVAAREDLRDRYDAYAAQYGPINRFTLSKSDSRITPQAPRLMRGDPFAPQYSHLSCSTRNPRQHATQPSWGSVCCLHVLSAKVQKHLQKRSRSAATAPGVSTSTRSLTSSAPTRWMLAPSWGHSFSMTPPVTGRSSPPVSTFRATSVSSSIRRAQPTRQIPAVTARTSPPSRMHSPKRSRRTRSKRSSEQCGSTSPRISSSSARRSKTGTSRSNLPPRKVEGNGQQAHVACA